ncbi:hypothetical protein R3P38DRAFT_2600206 [Favolaschia claudopus]|uniref:Uncharacterized protein n=1 Tax=Favolaschia claudopus TaxID=2862362 RepID=A0AAW0DR84_9AGAR
MSLKERIAAIQQKEDRDREQRERAVSPLPPAPQPHGGPAVVLPASASAGALRAKIAQFEGKGGIPVPRSSLGLGAPPESSQPKRKADGMLYGNRMQPARIPSATLGLARPSEAFSAFDPRTVPLPESEPNSPVSPRLLQSDPSLSSHAHTIREEKKQIVRACGTAFNTALDIARKADADVAMKSERRKSAHWLTPQHTGGTLLPQYTGSLSPQNTGNGKLTPQHSGSGLTLITQYTGSSVTSGTLVPQLTGGSIGTPYSPRGFGSPTGRDSRRLSFGPMSPPIEPLSFDSQGDSGPLLEENEGGLLTEEPAAQISGGVLTEMPTGKTSPSEEENTVLAVDLDVAEPEEEPVPSTLHSQDSPEDTDAVSLPADPQQVDESSVPSPSQLQTEPQIDAIESVHDVDARDEVEEQFNQPEPLPSIETTAETRHNHSASVDSSSHSVHTLNSDAPSSPDSAHPGFDLDAHLHARAFPPHALAHVFTSSLPSDPNPTPTASTSTHLQNAQQSHFEDSDSDGEQHKEEEEDDDEHLRPLPNLLHTHAFRAHLSTITERSSIAWSGTGSPPGSAAWDGRFGVYEQEERRYSTGSDAEDRYRYSYGGADRDEDDAEEAASSNPPVSAFVDGFKDAEEKERLWRTDSGSTNEDTVRMRRRPDYASTGFGSLAGLAQSIRGAPSSTSPTYDAAVDASAHPAFQTPSDAVIYSGVGSPYRLSGLTERGYSPSLRSRSSSRSDSVAGDDVDERGDELAALRTEDGDGELQPLTPHASVTVQEADGAEPEPLTPTPQLEEEHKQRSSYLSAQDVIPGTSRDSLLSLAVSNSHRDSIASQRNSFQSERTSISSQRDSLSSTYGQVLSIRPSSMMTMSDGGSPSHVALAHRIPIAEQISALGVARAMIVPSPMVGDAVLGADRDTGSPSQSPSTARQLPTPPALVRVNSSPSTSAVPPVRSAEEPAPARRRHGFIVGAPRPHTDYIPPAPDSDEESGGMVDEFGTVSFGFSQSTGKRGFHAVVHGRVREASNSRPNGGTWSPESRRQNSVDKRLPPMPPETPMSPGYASSELADLLASTAALEARLERGELPGEALRRLSMRPQPQSSLNAASRPPMPPVPQGIGKDTAEVLRPLRSSSLKKQTSLSRSRSERRKERNKEEKRVGASSSMGNLLQMQDALASSPTPPSAMTVSTSMPTLTRAGSSNLLLSPIPPSPSPSSISEVPPTPPPKSPGAKYFSSLRRLASTTRAMPQMGRPSVSSSEDSTSVSTPADGHEVLNINGLASPLGRVSRSTSPQSNVSPHGSPHIGGVAWPALSSKKSAGSLGKSAASFAGKLWSRTRSKSSTSTVSSLSNEGASSPPPPMPVSIPPLASPPILNLDAGSSYKTPFAIPPIRTSSYERDTVPDSPSNTTPIANPLPSRLPSTAPDTLARTKSHPAPHQRPPALVLTASNSTPSSLLPVPKTAPQSRPASWTSLSSGESSVAQSPLFDKAIFDAFPSVPQMPPQQPPSPPRPLPVPNRTNSLSSTGSGAGSPAGPARPLPPSPPGYYSSDMSSIRSTSTVSDRSLAGQNTGHGRDGMLARLAETQRRVNPLL